LSRNKWTGTSQSFPSFLLKEVQPCKNLPGRLGGATTPTFSWDE